MSNGLISPSQNKDAKEKDRAIKLPGQADMDNSLQNRHFSFWGNLRMSRKFLLVFGILSVFTAIIATVTLSGLNRVQSNYEDTLAKGIKIRSASEQLTIDLLQARNTEKNFLQQWRTQGYATTYENYAIPHKKIVAEMREDINQLTLLGTGMETSSTGGITQAQYETDIATLTKNVDDYEKSFTALVDAYHQKGFDEDTDFESQFRTAAVNMEFHLYGGLVGVDSIKVTYLRIRLSEKNYLADAAQPYADDVHSFIPVLKDQITLSTQFQPEDKADMLAQVDAYVTAFDKLVELDRKIIGYNQDLLEAASIVEALAAKIESVGNQLATDSINAARANSAQTFSISISTVVVALIISLLLAVAFSRQLTRPIISLTGIAREISESKFYMQAEVNSADEIGILAQTFNNMTFQLRGALQNLDHRAKELEQQTAQLEHANQQSEKRAQELRTIDEIGRNISTEKDIQKLLPSISQTVSERFGFYHIGIFLLDENNKFAVLLASNSSGGQEMLRRQHRLEIGQTGIVGNVAATGIPRIASDTGADAVFFNNPYLPQTCSELALPLKTEGRVIGVLDIQSSEINAFSNEDIDILTVLADQVSLAIQNARLFSQLEKSLAEANAIQHQFIRETWSRLPKEEKLSGYRYSIAGAVPLDNETEIAASADMNGKREVSTPIILRGETIGTLTVQVPKSERVNSDQMDLIKAVAERVAISAENARLFDETTRRAENERIISDITSKIGTSVRTESILRTTASELSQLLEDADIFIDLSIKTTNQNKKDVE